MTDYADLRKLASEYPLGFGPETSCELVRKLDAALANVIAEREEATEAWHAEIRSTHAMADAQGNALGAALAKVEALDEALDAKHTKLVEVADKLADERKKVAAALKSLQHFRLCESSKDLYETLEVVEHALGAGRMR